MFRHRSTFLLSVLLGALPAVPPAYAADTTQTTNGGIILRLKLDVSSQRLDTARQQVPGQPGGERLQLPAAVAGHHSFADTGSSRTRLLRFASEKPAASCHCELTTGLAGRPALDETGGTGAAEQ
jgi:hypothetical protein